MKKKYPFLKYLPILLPFMWVYRWFVILFTGRKKVKKFVKEMDNLNDENLKKVKTIMDITEAPID